MDLHVREKVILLELSSLVSPQLMRLKMHLIALPEKYWLNCPPEFKYFDFDEQTLKYPYPLYREKLKEKADREWE
jgi:hypothetical protein